MSTAKTKEAAQAAKLAAMAGEIQDLREQVARLEQAVTELNRRTIGSTKLGGDPGPSTYGPIPSGLVPPDLGKNKTRGPHER